jgi:hypothetical protein
MTKDLINTALLTLADSGHGCVLRHICLAARSQGLNCIAVLKIPNALMSRLIATVDCYSNSKLTERSKCCGDPAQVNA